jgi:hypothetical protein
VDLLEEDHAVDLSLLVDKSEYTVARPHTPEEEPLPREPDSNDPEFRPQFTLLARIIPKVRDKEKARVAANFRKRRRSGLTKWVLAGNE